MHDTVIRNHQNGTDIFPAWRYPRCGTFVHYRRIVQDGHYFDRYRNNEITISNFPDLPEALLNDFKPIYDRAVELEMRFEESQDERDLKQAIMLYYYAAMTGSRNVAYTLSNMATEGTQYFIRLR